MAVLTSLPTLHCPQFAHHIPQSDLYRHTNISNAMPSRKKENKIPKPAEVSVKEVPVHAEAKAPTKVVEEVPVDGNDTSPVSNVSCSPTMEQQAKARRSSEAEIEERLARIPGRVPHPSSSYIPNPERIAHLRQERAAALEGLKDSKIFQPCADMNDAISEIQWRQRWRNGSYDEYDE